MSEALSEVLEARPRRFRPYPAYKDSGVEWLGKIPTDWTVKRVKRLFEVVNGSTPKSGETDYWDGDIPWVTPDDLGKLNGSELAETGRSITRRGYESCGTSMVPAGSLVLSTRAPIGHLAVAGEALCTNQGCRSLVFRHAGNHRFFYFQVRAAKPVFEAMGHGSTFMELAKDDLESVPLCTPSAGEQQAIAAFLDRETAKIDALVAKKKRLIELLQEKRTALITRAVTKGLDSNVPMKDSGVEWLGEIPAHWECLALAWVTLSRCDGPFGSALKTEHYSRAGVRVVRLQNIGWAEFLDSDQAYIDEAYACELGEHTILSGDLLIAGLGDEGHPVGRACAAPEGIEPAMVKADCFRFRLDRRRLLARFAAYQLSATASAAAGSLATGATRSRMNLTTMAARIVTMPPLDEQRAMVKVLDRNGEKFRALVGRVRDAIDRLRELRTALISAAVTGKFDVREESVA